MDIVVGVAAHKPYRMHKDVVYLPLQVGAAGKDSIKDFQRDDVGKDNISAKNKNYCELTGLYWLWKNFRADAVGLCHYRRYFGSTKKDKDKWRRIAKKEDFERAFEKADIILPKKRNYFIETNYGQYVHAHHEEDLKITRQILEELYPEYVYKYDEAMRRTTGHRFNMFVMKRELIDEYCEWLFNVLFELEKRLDISEYSEQDARVFGYVSERLLDIWVETNNYDYMEMPVIYMEDENWLRKIYAFLMRKFLRSK